MRVQTHHRVPGDRDLDGNPSPAKLPIASVSITAPSPPTSRPPSRPPSSSRYSDSTGPPQLPLGKPSSVLVSEGTFLVFDDTSIASGRDSFTSIIDDPFFARFDSLGELKPIKGTTARNDLKAPLFPPRRESLNEKSSTPWFERSQKIMEAVNIAVIGADGVGKSAFIQRALNLPRPPSLNVTAVRLDVDGVLYLITLVELDIEGFDVNSDLPIQWPKQIGGHIMPRMDGALILYDVTDKESIRDLPQTMSALGNSSLPTGLVATKCDAPDDVRQVDSMILAHTYTSCVVHYKTSSNVPESARDCLLAMLRATLRTRKGVPDKSEGAMARRRAASTANLDAPDVMNGRPISQNSKHSRASSDFSLLRGIPPSSTDSYYRGGAMSRSPRLEYQLHAQYGTPNLNMDPPQDGPSQTVSSMLRTPGIRLDAESFLDIEESDAESYRYSDDIPILQRNDESFLDRPAKATGVSFDELVDRLLAPKMTRADNNFADIFLCLYRKFASPGELLTAILTRLERVRTDRSAQFLTKVEAQMRIIEVIAKWLSMYPGDFARPPTRRKLEELIRQLAGEAVFSAAAQQMRAHLEQKVVEDDDTGWAKSDDPVDGSTQGGGRAPAAGRDGLGQRQGGLADSMSSLQLEEPGFPDQGRPSQSSEQSTSDPRATGSTPVRFQFHSFEDYEREAATMVPSSTLPLNKVRYHIFMGIEPEDIADEITRIDWVMFSSIHIRDLVRHVSLPADQKEKCRSLRNVNRMVAHFNHVAKWVANMILIRDKPKHRAPCLEKFMVVALKLRQLNNYNGLAAVLAGINDTAIHRLAQTRQLVSADVQKRFMRLVLLMGTQKSHFAYRLAWENSPLPRIPFMPLHRRDLVSAEQGSRTLVGPNGDRINWKKFEVLGEILLPIMRSQGQPYPNLHRHELSRELILDCRIDTDDETLYQYSLLKEPNTGGAADRKKFPWLPK